MILRLVQSLFDHDNNLQKKHHDNYHGVKAHENGMFLYKSNQGDGLLRSRMADYFMAFGFLGLVTG